MPYQITVGTSSSTRSIPKRGWLSRVKSIVLAFLILSLAAGVVAAAFLLGIVIAGLILMGIIVTVCVLWVSRIWRRRA